MTNMKRNLSQLKTRKNNNTLKRVRTVRERNKRKKKERVTTEKTLVKLEK